MRRACFLCLMAALWWRAGTAVYAAAPVDPPPPLLVEVIDDRGQPVRNGVVAICTATDDCHEFSIAPGGQVSIDADLLLRSVGLIIVVHGADGSVRYVASDWAMSAADRRILANRPHEARGQLRGNTSLGLDLTFARTSPPPPQPDRPSDAPDVPAAWSVGVGATWLVGGAYTTDDAVVGGVNAVSAGPVVALGHRWGLPPTWPTGRPRLDFFELTLGYALNRYRVGQLRSPGESDLGFHRVTVAVGAGRAWRHGRVVVQGVVGYGGVLDRTTVLEREGRRYSMLGVGITARVSRLLATVGGRRVGVMAGASAINYLADQGASDHWYGTAPSVFVGAVAE